MSHTLRSIGFIILALTVIAVTSTTSWAETSIEDCIIGPDGDAACEGPVTAPENKAPEVPPKLIRKGNTMVLESEPTQSELIAPDNNIAPVLEENPAESQE